MTWLFLSVSRCSVGDGRRIGGGDGQRERDSEIAS